MTTYGSIEYSSIASGSTIKHWQMRQTSWNTSMRISLQSNLSLLTNLTTMWFAILLQEEFTISWLTWVNKAEKSIQILIGQATSKPIMMVLLMPMIFTIVSMLSIYLISCMPLISVSCLIGIVVQTEETI